MEETKLLLKICSSSGQISDIPDKWVHLCYIDSDLYDKFLKASTNSDMSLNEILSKWCQEDLHTENPVITQEQLNELKQGVRDMYKSIYPELYRETDVDRQGWMRTWITKKMKETIDNGEKCI